MMNFQILVNQNGMMYTHFVSSDTDLVKVFAEALENKSGYVIWDKGCFDFSQIVGILKE